MKLELKHLAPYLPYGLKFESNLPFEKDILTMVGLREENGMLSILDKEGSMWIDSVKPILRPLSDLTEEDFESAEWVQSKEIWSELSYPQWQFLFENHYDVFGLIEKGLAIDKNTL